MNALDKCDKGRGIFDSHHRKSLKASSVGVASSGTPIINVNFVYFLSSYSKDPFMCSAAALVARKMLILEISSA